MKSAKKKFSKIYDKYVNKIYRFVFLKVETQEAAQDITSQVFTKAWEKMREQNRREDEVLNWPAYIYQIARNQIFDHYKLRSRFQIISTEALEIAAPSFDFEEKEDKKSEIKNMKIALSGLNEDSQNVLILRYLDEMAFAEIAEILNKPEPTVRVIAHRALKELRGRMEGIIKV